MLIFKRFYLTIFKVTENFRFFANQRDCSLIKYSFLLQLCLLPKWYWVLYDYPHKTTIIWQYSSKHNNVIAVNIYQIVLQIHLSSKLLENQCSVLFKMWKGSLLFFLLLHQGLTYKSNELAQIITQLKGFCKIENYSLLSEI